MHDGQVTVTRDAVAAAIAAQLPQLAGLEVRPVPSAGTVVAPFRVGPGLVARMPFLPDARDEAWRELEAEGAHADALRVALPVAVPELVAVGEPFATYGGVWSVWTWLDGRSLDALLDQGGAGCDLDALAIDLAAVLRAQRALPTGEASWNGAGRGGRPFADTAWVRESIERSGHLIDTAAATRVWESALAAPAYDDEPVTINGDPMPGNLLVTDGRLSGLIDIGRPVVGDPASDLQPAWQIFDEPQRSAFRQAMGLDDAAWERGRGWSFEMAIGGLHYYEHTNPVFHRLARRTLDRLVGQGSSASLCQPTARRLGVAD